MWVLFLLLPVGMWNKGMAWAQIVVTAMWILGTAVAVIPRLRNFSPNGSALAKGAKQGIPKLSA